MAKNPSIEHSLLVQLLRYDAETGKLYWRERRPIHFADRYYDDGGLAVTQQWNERWAGKETFTKQNRRTGARHGRIAGKTLMASRVAFALHWGHWPEGIIEHWDGVQANNHIFNLRDVDTTIYQMRMQENITERGVPVGPDPKTLWGLQYTAQMLEEDLSQEGHDGQADPSDQGTEMIVAGQGDGAASIDLASLCPTNPETTRPPLGILAIDGQPIDGRPISGYVASMNMQDPDPIENEQETDDGEETQDSPIDHNVND